MAGLRPRDREILRLRFGFETGEVETLETVAKRYGITRERVRQLEMHAVSLLRRSKSATALLERGARRLTTSRRDAPASVSALQHPIRGSSMAEQAAVNR